MALVGWAVLGIVIGAAGTELLRATKRTLVEKTENAAARFADSLCCPRPSANEADKEAGEEAEDE